MSDLAGQPVYASGLIDNNGQIEKYARVFNSDGMGDDFHFAVDPWIITSFSKHDTIPPKGFKDVYFGVPNTASKEIDISVKLRYRQADQKIAEKLLSAVPDDINLKETYGIDKVPTLPIVVMVYVSKKFDYSKH